MVEKFLPLLSDVNECDPNPCACGAPCIDLIGQYFCECPDGCGGVRCENGKLTFLERIQSSAV